MHQQIFAMSFIFKKKYICILILSIFKTQVPRPMTHVPESQATHSCVLHPKHASLCLSPHVSIPLLVILVPIALSFLLAGLSLVFICRENPRRSGILLFPDRPRFCRLMKTRNRKCPRSSGMVWDKSGESGAFLFSRRIPDFCDGRRSFKIYENSNS